MPLKLNTASSGSVTLDAANTASNFTITVPATTGTMALTSNIPASYTNADVLTLFSASGSAPVYACRAWVNFNGTGTVAIRASGNVSSITDNDTGDYTVNFTTAMPDANYSTITAGGNFNNSGSHDGIVFSELAVSGTRTTTSNRIRSKQLGSGQTGDIEFACIAFFR